MWIFSTLCLAGLVVGTIWSVGFYRSIKRRCQFARNDLQSGYVQILHIVDPILVQQIDEDEDPILYFEIAEGLVLLLMGQWLLEPSIYGFAGEPPLSEVDHLNGLPDPFGFPSREFEITRAERSGEVFAIKVLGAYLEPIQRLAWKDLRPGDCGESEVFPGDIQDIPAAVEDVREGRV